MSEIKNTKLERSNLLTITGALMSEANGMCCIVPVQKAGLSNTTTSSSSGEYDGGDRVIGLGAYGVDGDLLLTTGWGDGCAIRRINNDGSMTKLYHDNNALMRDTSSTYNHINSMAFHAASSQICLTTHNVNGYSMIDYSDIKDTSTSTNNVVNTRPSSQYVFDDGTVRIDRSGLYYCSGTVTAGDWLYILDYDATHYCQIPRRKWTDGTEELLSGKTGSSDLYSGSAVIDRNGYRGYIAYDEINDRVFYNFYYNGNFVVVDDASTANPKIIWCDLGDAGAGDDGYENGVFVPDPTNYPNKIVIGANGRHVYVDITPCLSGNAPTIIKTYWTDNASNGQGIAPGILFRAGTNRQTSSNSADWIDKMPGYPNYMPICSDRGKMTMGGWIDFDNDNIVAPMRHESRTEDTTTGGRGATYYADYCNPMFRMKSANGTKWWVKTAYGGNGHSFKVWSDTYGNQLIGNWSVEFGTFQMTNTSQNIDFVHVATHDHFVTGGHSLSMVVSNNNGTTYESYTANSVHTFSSSGTQLRVKYIATGGPDKAPYKMSFDKDQVTYGILYTGLTTSDIPTKIVRRKIRGRKS
tara:strand:- start:19097 stop:20836 length:1740 start_codon:yes stop_codon:yes gene_type:complete